MPELLLHGPPAVRLDDGRTLALSAREAALLAWLHLEGAAPRARLAGLLWPDGGEARARTNLRQTLARLKRGAGALLDESDGVLRLAPSVRVAAAGEAPLLGTLAFDDAPALAEWLAARREAVQREQQRERLAQARERLAVGDLDAALAAADALLARDAAIEEAHRVRMEAHYLRGDRAAAIAAWDECRLALRAAFGIAPSVPTQALGATILATESVPFAPAVVPTLPAALRRPPRLVGRDDPLREIERSVARGHAVVLAGIAGIGKSRLIAEAAERLAPALVVGARAGDTLVPGTLAARLARAALEAFDPQLDAGTRDDLAQLTAPTATLRSPLEHRRVLGSLGQALLACAARGMRLVAVDDLQFADDESVAALHLLAGAWLADPPPCVAVPLFGLRPDELRPPARALVDALAVSQRSARIDLAPLGSAPVRRLLDDLPLPAGCEARTDRDALAAALHARVGGHPAFLLEALRTLWLEGAASWQPGDALPLPATLRDSVLRRVQALPREALHLAQLAALAGNDFTPELGARVLGLSLVELAPLLQHLEQAQVFGGAAFQHELMAEAVRRSVPAALAPALHRAVAEHLAAQGGAPSAVAFHFDAAGRTVQAAAWHLRAARAARERWQMADAARGFEAVARALGAGAQLPQEAGYGMALAWRDAARCRITLGEPELALAALDAGLAASPRPRERLLLRASRALALWNLRRSREALEASDALARDLEAESDALDDDERATALFGASLAAAIHPQPERLLALARTLRPPGKSAAARTQASMALSLGVCAHWSGWPREAQAALERGWAIAAQAGDHGMLFNLATQAMRVTLWQGDAAGAARWCDAVAQARVDARQGESFDADALGFRALLALAQDGAAQALPSSALAQAIVDAQDHPPPPELWATHALALCAAGRGAEALARLDRLPPSEAAEALPFVPWARVRVLAALGAEALAIDAALDAAQATCPAPLALQGLRQQVLRARRQGASLAALRALVATLDERGLVLLARSARVAAATAAQREGRHEEAASWAAQALALPDLADPWVDDAATARAQARALLSLPGGVRASG